MTTDDANVELLPCPFCGGDATTWCDSAGDRGADRMTVMCVDCEAEAPYVDTSVEGKAIAAWNRRASGWIPTDTRAPTNGDCDKYGFVLATRFNGAVEKTHFLVIRDSGPKVFPAWQPLPAAYEPEGSE